MIRFSLKCDQDHVFESWFSSNDAFEKLDRANMVTCATCGSDKVEKTLMAPKVSTSRAKADEPALTKPDTEAEKALAQMKAEVEKNSDYVGMNFAKEARAMHDGDQPSRAIYGEAKLEEAKSLIEDGVPVAPLPFVPKRSTN